MQTTQASGRVVRGAALMTGGVLMASTLLPATPARAADDEKKSKNYKTGAIVLGAAAAYMILKGKTVPAAIAGAGAYYAYKKSKDAKNEGRYSQSDSRRPSQDRYPDDPTFSRNPDADSQDYRYDDGSDYDVASYPDNGYDAGYDGAYNGLRAAGARKARTGAVSASQPSIGSVARSVAKSVARSDSKASKDSRSEAGSAPQSTTRTVLK